MSDYCDSLSGDSDDFVSDADELYSWLGVDCKVSSVIPQLVRIAATCWVAHLPVQIRSKHQ